MRPPLVLPCFFTYFFFAAFFAAFFAGFFAAFLVAMVIYSPYLCTATTNAAVNECIEFLKKSVKKKMTNFAIECFVQDRSHDESDGKNLKHMRVFEQHEGDSGKNIVPCVRHHAWT